MNCIKQYNITITGCGLSGMITALCFAYHKIPVTIIEKYSIQDRRFLSDIRTTALTSASKRFLHTISIWQQIEDFVSPINDIYVVDNKSDQMLHFDSSDIESDDMMGYLIKNIDFKKLLLEMVLNHQLINIIDHSSYTVVNNNSKGCVLSIASLSTNSKESPEKRSHECDLLILCDGYSSVARKLYFTSAVEKSYQQHAITFIIRHSISHDGTAMEHFTPSGPFATLPLKDPYISSIVWTIDSDKYDVIMNLPKDEFLYLMRQYCGDSLGELEITTSIAGFPLKAYVSNKYFNQKIALVADTAHIIHPLAGQGLNQGIKDIESLISSLLLRGINDDALNHYQEMRKSDNMYMFQITNTLNSVFTNNSNILHSMRQIGFMAINKISYLKKYIVKYAMGKR